MKSQYGYKKWWSFSLDPVTIWSMTLVVLPVASVVEGWQVSYPSLFTLLLWNSLATLHSNLGHQTPQIRLYTEWNHVDAWLSKEVETNYQSNENVVLTLLPILGEEIGQRNVETVK